jgi:hypothetical protein
MRLAILRAKTEPLAVMPRMGVGFKPDDPETWDFFADDKMNKPVPFPAKDDVLLWQEVHWMTLVWYLPYLYRWAIGWLRSPNPYWEPAVSMDKTYHAADGSAVDLHNLIADSRRNTEAEALRNHELEKLSDGNREWFRLLFEMGVQPGNVVGEKPATARQRKKRLLETLLPVLDASGSSHPAPRRVNGSGDVVSLEVAKARLKHLVAHQAEGEGEGSPVAHYRRWAEALSLKMPSGRLANPDQKWTDLFGSAPDRSWRPCDYPGCGRETALKRKTYTLPNGDKYIARLCGTHRKEIEQMVQEIKEAIKEEGRKTREANQAEHHKTRLLLFQQKVDPPESERPYPPLKAVDEAA